MSPTFSDDEIGKPVETADGEVIGVVADVDRETAYVEPKPGITDSTKATLDWEASADAVPIGDDAVGRITDDALRLGDEFPAASITSGATEESDTSGAATQQGETDVTGATDMSAAPETAGNETESAADGPTRRTGSDDRTESNRDANDLEGSGPGMDDHDEADESALMDAAEEIDGDSERAGTGLDPGDEGDADSTESGTRDDVDVDVDEVTDGDPDAEIRSGEDVE